MLEFAELLMQLRRSLLKFFISQTGIILATFELEAHDCDYCLLQSLVFLVISLELLKQLREAFASFSCCMNDNFCSLKILLRKRFRTNNKI